MKLFNIFLSGVLAAGLCVVSEDTSAATKRRVKSGTTTTTDTSSSTSTSTSTSTTTTATADTSSGGSGSTTTTTTRSGSTSTVSSSTTQVKLSWTVPASRMDGSALSSSEVSGYDLSYAGRNSGATGVIHLAGGTSTQYVLSNLTADNYDVAVFAYDSNGLASSASNVVSVVLN